MTLAVERNLKQKINLNLTTEVVPKIFPNLNVVAHLVLPAGWGSCLLRLAIFAFMKTCSGFFHLIGGFFFERVNSTQ